MLFRRSMIQKITESKYNENLVQHLVNWHGELRAAMEWVDMRFLHGNKFTMAVDTKALSLMSSYFALMVDTSVQICFVLRGLGVDIFEV